MLMRQANFKDGARMFYKEHCQDHNGNYTNLCVLIEVKLRNILLGLLIAGVAAGAYAVGRYAGF